MERHFHRRLTRALTLLTLMALPITAHPQQAPPPVGPGGPFPPVGPPIGGFGGGFALPMPELAKKMSTIMALREMLEMGLTARHISTALPVLKELQAAEKTLKEQSERLLEAEKQTLLAAQPDDPLPADSGEKMRKLMENYREKQESLWGTLSKSLGENRINRLRALLGQGAARPFQLRGGQPLGPEGLVRPGIQPPGDDAGGVRPDDPEGGFPPAAGAPGAFGGRQGGPAAPRPPGQPGGRQGGGRAAPPPFPQPGPFIPGWSPFGPPHLTLAELIDLMEQKLAALRR